MIARGYRGAVLWFLCLWLLGGWRERVIFGLGCALMFFVGYTLIAAFFGFDPCNWFDQSVRTQCK